jgi:uncharacterized protein
MRPEFTGRVRVEAEISPSEDVEKVALAVLNVVGGAQGSLEKSDAKVRFESSDLGCLDRLHDQLRDRHVRSAARRILLVGREGGRATVMLNRQAAAVGVIALCGTPEESPLGPVYLTIESRPLDGVIDWLTAYEAG